MSWRIVLSILLLPSLVVLLNCSGDDGSDPGPTHS